MKTFAYAALLICSLGLSALAFADEPPTLDVWPGNPPGEKIAGSEQWQGKHVTHVSKPTLEIFRPEKDKDTGVSVIVCPGGGYKSLMMDYEGEDVARWLNTIGITGIVLKYRVPAPPGTPKYEPALQDAQRSISIVRSKAKEWGLKEDRIGMLGFSAGAHLTAAASTNFDKRSYEPVDDIDKVSCRPDFAVVVYPGGVIAKNADGTTTGALSPEIRVSAKTPPTFIAQANDDPVNSENAARLYLVLKRAGVPAELHIYAIGGHGFGIRPTTKPCSTWTDRCVEWMKHQGILGEEKH
jgi:acetyl esterase/lipase